MIDSPGSAKIRKMGESKEKYLNKLGTYATLGE